MSKLTTKEIIEAASVLFQQENGDKISKKAEDVVTQATSGEYYLHFLLKELSVKEKRDIYEENSYKFFKKAFWKVWLKKKVNYFEQ